MEDIRSVEKLIFPSYFMGSIDLEDAYFSVPIHKSSRKYLRFKFLNKLYEFTCLPFGLKHQSLHLYKTDENSYELSMIKEVHFCYIS